MNNTTHQATLGATAVGAARGVDPEWARLVADYRQKYAAWSEAANQEDAADEAFHAACASLPAEPQAPPFWEGDISHMTTDQLRATRESQAYKAARARYERERETWKAQREALRAEMVGAAKAHHDGAYAAYDSALRALAMYRTSSAADLAEKIETLAADYKHCQFPHEYLAEFIADARQLAGGARP